MRFKNMYACVMARRSDKEDKYTNNGNKSTSCKENSKSSNKKFKPKWQVPSTATNNENNNQKPQQEQHKKDNNNTKKSTTTTKSTVFANQCPITRGAHDIPCGSLLDRTLSPVPLPSPIKSVKAESSVFDAAFAAPIIDTPSSGGGGDSWLASIAPPPPPQPIMTSQQDISQEKTLKLIEEMSKKSVKRNNKPEAVTSSTNAVTSPQNEFEDLKLEMMRKYGFVSTGSSDHRKPDVTSQHHKLPANPATKLDWNEIPPVIPPREPVLRHHNRHSSTPSPPTTCPTPSTANGPLRVRSLTTTTTTAHQGQQPSTVSIFRPVNSPCTSSPRIYPIVDRNGKQESHTHYFLIAGEEKTQEQIRREQLKNEPLCSIPRPIPSTSYMNHHSRGGMHLRGGIHQRNSGHLCAPPRPPPPTSQSLISTIPPPPRSVETSFMASAPRLETSTTSNTSNNSNSNETATFPPRRTSTATSNYYHDNTSSLHNHHRNSILCGHNDTAIQMGTSQKSLIIQSKVFGVTNDECRTALRTHNGDLDETIRYLKVEQLFRLGVAPREICKGLLQGCGWDLEIASRKLVEKHRRSKIQNSTSQQSTTARNNQQQQSGGNHATSNHAT